MNTVELRGQTYQLGRFSDLHLAPIAEFIQNGIKTDESSWGYTAKMIAKIVPDIPTELVDPKGGEIYLSVKELQTVYSAALAKIPSYESEDAGARAAGAPRVVRQDSSLNLDRAIANSNLQQASTSEINALKEKIKQLEQQNQQLENQDS